MTGQKQPCSPNGWTLDKLEKYLSDQIDALRGSVRQQDEQNKERFVAAKEQVNLALASADKAITKADLATEKRFEGVNEFRKTLADQAATLMPRQEYTVRHDALAAQVIDLGARMLKMETSGLTKAEVGTRNISTIIAVVSVTYGIIASFGVVITLLLNHGPK